MNKKDFNLSIFAIALASLFFFAAPNASMAAAGDNYNNTFNGSTNLIGIDDAHDGWALAGSRDMDRSSKLDFQASYGLHGDWGSQR